MLFRAIALTLALLVSIGTIIPLGTDSAEAGSNKTKKRYKKKKYKKYSKRWWRQYHARMKRKRALQARRRAMRLRQLRLARKRAHGNRNKAAVAAKPKKVEQTPSSTSVAMLPGGQAAPSTWKRGSSSSGEVNFSLDNGNGSAAISVVGPSTGETVDSGRQRAVGGVPTSALRREVINRMVRENGWVVNDYQKTIGGRSVYVVVAQSQNGSRVHSRMFYFTEADGRVYSVATNSAAESADRIAEESEKVIFSLASRPAQQALVRE
ncbi:MAG TPA: hypothetical protein VJV05_01945 [Pyrinomonadaceae bacterium]|nr:hypothetical protein [Pyrinomonadaceae bacterium]